MPKKTRVVRRKQVRPRIKRSHRVARGNGSTQSFGVHRRLAVYPKTDGSSWLDSLAWLGSIALKAFAFVAGVGDDLSIDTTTASVGSSLMIGPATFASVCPAASSTFTATDKEVIPLRVLPYERGSLRNIKIRIVPSVDQGSRGGMYAAVILPVDQAAHAQSIAGARFPERFVPDYDKIIKNPRAKMAQATQVLTLSIGSNAPPHNLTATWTDDGFINNAPSHVLMIGFSSMAAEMKSVAAEYTPSRALFEVHMYSTLLLHEPSSLPQPTDKPKGNMSDYSFVTQKIERTDDKDINVRFFDKSWEVPFGSKPSLLTAPYHLAESITKHYRPELLTELRVRHPESLDGMVLE